MPPRLVARDVCAWPVLLRLDRERLGLVFFNRPSHGLEEGDLCALVSGDDGLSWRPAGVAARHDPGANRMHLASGVRADGAWLVLSTGFAIHEGRLGALQPVRLSLRETGTDDWREHHDVRLHGLPPAVIPHGRIVTLRGGGLAATFYRAEGRGRPSAAWLVVSEDGGLAWTVRGVIDGVDANEVVLLPMAGDRLLAAARTQADHHVALHLSDDEGRSWRGPVALTGPMEHPADLTDLGDGRVLLTFGIRRAGCAGIGARMSRDGGATWGNPWVVQPLPGAVDCGYPSTVRFGAGEVLTAYYADTSTLHPGYQLASLAWTPPG